MSLLWTGSGHEAVRWYRKAAEQGNIGAQNNLGYKYLEGKGVSQDYVKAHKWLYLASGTGTGNTHASKNRDGIAKIMTPDQLSEAKGLIRKWKLQKGK